MTPKNITFSYDNNSSMKSSQVILNVILISGAAKYYHNCHKFHSGNVFSHISYLSPSNGCNELSKGFGYTEQLTRATIVKRNALDGYKYYCIALVMNIVLH